MGKGEQWPGIVAAFSKQPRVNRTNKRPSQDAAVKDELNQLREDLQSMKKKLKKNKTEKQELAVGPASSLAAQADLPFKNSRIPASTDELNRAAGHRVGRACACSTCMCAPVVHTICSFHFEDQCAQFKKNCAPSRGVECMHSAFQKSKTSPRATAFHVTCGGGRCYVV